jgi:hypothetical protein
LWTGETPAVFNAPALATVPSSHLAVRVDPLDGVPGYRIVIANDAPQSVTALRLAAYRGEQMVISALRRGDRNHPLVAAKSDYTYELMTSNTRTDGADAAGWATIDRLAITAVLWEDGLVEGEAWPIEQDRRIHATRHKQLATVLQTIAEARSPSDLRAALQRFIEDSDTTSRQLAETVLEDLNTFDRSATSGTPAYRQWLESKAAEYREWLVRIERDLASLPHADSGR